MPHHLLSNVDTYLFTQYIIQSHLMWIVDKWINKNWRKIYTNLNHKTIITEPIKRTTNCTKNHHNLPRLSTHISPTFTPLKNHYTSLIQIITPKTISTLCREKKLYKLFTAESIMMMEKWKVPSDQRHDFYFQICRRKKNQVTNVDQMADPHLFQIHTSINNKRSDTIYESHLFSLSKE